jgi:hypothetical protein
LYVPRKKMNPVWLVAGFVLAGVAGVATRSLAVFATVLGILLVLAGYGGIRVIRTSLPGGRR